MSERKWNQLGPGVRYFIWGGIPGSAIMLEVFLSGKLAWRLGEKFAAYALLGIAGVISIVGLILYDYIPERLVIPLGVTGWLMFFCIGYYYANIRLPTFW